MAAINVGFEKNDEGGKKDDSSESDSDAEGGKPKVKFDATTANEEGGEGGGGGFRRRAGSNASASSSLSRARAKRMQLNKQYSKVSLYGGFNMDLNDPEPEEEYGKEIYINNIILI